MYPMISTVLRDQDSNLSSVITFFSHGSKCAWMSVVRNLPSNVNVERLSIIETAFLDNFYWYRELFIGARTPPRRRAIAFGIGDVRYYNY